MLSTFVVWKSIQPTQLCLSFKFGKLLYFVIISILVNIEKCEMNAHIGQDLCKSK